MLAGENVLLGAPTASGKTEAALAPLIERYLPPRLEGTAPPGLTILYLLPTRALINDVAARLAAPLEALRVSRATKTHDLNTFDPKRPTDLLLTTPESLDALLAGQAKALAGVQAVVIDELHIFEGTARGDQLQVLMNRLRQVRVYAAQAGDAETANVQGVALSATLAQPETSAARYFAGAHVVEVTGARPIRAEQIAMDADSPGALLDYLRTFRQRGWRKALAFCNTRAEIESWAAAVRAAGSPFGEAVYVHYSNLEWERRVEIERQFAQAEAALCFASSTLELGIDVGNIDVALLVGAPGSTAAFVQRVGRANRRQRVARVACFYRTPLERVMFGALLHAQDHAVPPAAFRPSVAVQQIFSLLKQSPAGAVRLAPLGALFAGLLSADEVRAILGHLQALGYLQSGRPGEWRAGDRLNRLVDLQSAEHSTLSIHSNIETGGAGQVKIRDQQSGRVVANVDRQWFDREVLTLEGRAINVEWYDGESLWVSPHPGDEDPAAHMHYLSTRQVLSYDLARRFPAQLGLAPGSAPLITQPDGYGWLLFHWLGDVYGRAAGDLAGYVLPVEDTAQPGICLGLRDDPQTLPLWTVEQVTRYLRDHYRAYEPLLGLGAYQHLLPPELRQRAVIAQFDVARFLRAAEDLRMERAPEALTQELQALLV
jgi:ATP-dependent Lhr-like helicase